MLTSPHLKIQFHMKQSLMVAVNENPLIRGQGQKKGQGLKIWE